LTLALVLSVVFGFVSWLSSDSIIRLLTNNSEQIALGTMYLHAYALFLPAMFVLSVGCGLLRGAGETFTAMKCVGFYALAFILFGYIMVAAPWTPNFNTPELVREGIRRLALANALAETVGALMALYYLLLRQSGFTFPVGEMWPLNRRVQKQIIQLCLPSAGEMGTMRLGFFVFNKILLTLGSAAFAAHRVAVSVEMLSFLPGFGFGVAATTLVGQAVGAQDYAFAERAVRRTARIATYVMVATGAMLALFAGPLVKGLYNPEPEVAYLATWCVVVSALEQPMLGFMFTYSGALRGAGDTVSPMILRLIGSLAIRLPLAYAVATWTDWGVIGIWAAVVLEWAIGCVVVFWLFKKGRWRRTRLPSLHQRATSEEPANPRA
jgi:putative MATE family efflux protein